MPSAEETTYLIEVMQDPSITSADSFTSHDVDVLVSRIKKNLRLSSLKSRSSLAASQKMRASPYALPSRTWAAEAAGSCELCSSRTASAAADAEARLAAAHHHRHQHHSQHQQHHHHHHHFHYYPRHEHQDRCRRCRKPGPLDLDDSYERFQALLRSGALIKEAVKRLQTIPDDELADEEDNSNNNGSGSASKRRATSTSATSTTLDSMDEEDEEEEDEDEDDFVARRKHFDYDSEDEPIDAEA